ncbi:MAG: bacteriohemerythrin [Burkholderiales bacterium]|jgi:hemerythrin|nr:bacteriohemerythrin [Burkholderiales bacterium]
MAHLEWSDSLSVGVKVIDKQHQRILDYVNKLHDHLRDRRVLAEVLEDTIEYTESHFAFEEAMMEEADYPYLRAHKRIHDLFIRRVARYKERFLAGEDVAEELHDTLVRWLITHIKSEDANYGPSLIQKFGKEEAELQRKRGIIARILGR